MITATYPPSANGVAVSTLRTVRELRRVGHHVGILGPKTSIVDPDYIAFQTIRHMPFVPADYPVIVPLLTPQLIKKLEKISWDVIHVHHHKPVGSIALALGKLFHIPVVFTYHTQYDRYIETHAGWIPSIVKKWLYRIAVRNLCVHVNGVIATTRWLREVLQRKLPRQNVYYASTAGLESPFAVSVKKQSLRQKYKIPVNGSVFITVSRLSKEKSISFLIKAFSLWARRHMTGTLIIVGDGPYRGRLEYVVHKKHLEARIQFTGKIPNADLGEWYCLANVFLYCSLTDTIGINIIEAMSARLPVVARNHITTREVIRNGFNGILAGKGIKRFVSAMDEAMQKRTVLSRGAFEKSKEYMIGKTTTDLVDVYRDVIRRYV